MMCHTNKEYLLISTSYYYDECISLVSRFKSLFIYNILNPECYILQKYNTIRYLDRFYLELPNSTVEQKEYWNDLYSYIDGSYESYIDISNNLACIDLLINNLNSYHLITNESLILDFGCGSGLSLKTEWSSRCHIIGYERNYSMYKTAESRGMTVYLPKTISNCQDNSIDAVFSSYVFHMSVDYDDLEGIFPKLRKNAPWSINFYKNINTHNTIQVFEDFGYKYESLGTIRKIGSIYVFYK